MSAEEAGREVRKGKRGDQARGMLAARRLKYLFGFGRVDLVNEVERYHHLTAGLYGLGLTDDEVVATVDTATGMLICGVTPELTRWMARIAATGVLTSDDIDALGALGVDTSLVGH